MWKYIIKRILLFIPSLLAVTLLAFIISIKAPGDPVQRMLSISDGEGGQQSSKIDFNKTVKELRTKLGLNLPAFYFSLETAADIDTINLISEDKYHDVLSRLVQESGEEKLVLDWYFEMKNTASLLEKHFVDTLNKTDSQFNSQITNSVALCDEILQTVSKKERKIKEDSLNIFISLNTGLADARNSWQKAKNTLQKIESYDRWYLKWIPHIHWHGLKNQYHFWLVGNGKDTKGILRGDFGTSYRDGLPIAQRIGSKIKWSLTLAFVSIFLAFVISIPVGTYAAYKAGSWFDKLSKTGTFLLFSIPSFFGGTLLLVLFANPDVLDWFPASGVKDAAIFDPNWSFLTKIQHYLPYLVLPLITYTYGSFAFITAQIKSSVRQQLTEDYVRTARAKGQSEWNVVIKHALRNSLLPIITILGNMLPLALGGSVVIETIFSIPGMGLEIYESIQNLDYPMIIAIFTLFGVATMIGYLLADIGYALVDPRIKLDKK
jgi:peptide/nickel transport system permease protein